MLKYSCLRSSIQESKLTLGLFGSLDRLSETSSFEEFVEIVAIDVSNGIRTRRKLVAATQFCDVRLECTFNRIPCQIIGGIESARLEQDTSVSKTARAESPRADAWG
jgi:hypothetical protein